MGQSSIVPNRNSETYYDRTVVRSASNPLGGITFTKNLAHPLFQSGENQLLITWRFGACLHKIVLVSVRTKHTLPTEYYLHTLPTEYYLQVCGTALKSAFNLLDSVHNVLLV